MKPIQIKTERLLLKPLSVEYLEAVHEYASDHEITRLMMFLPNENMEESRAFLKTAEAEWEKEELEDCEFALFLGDILIGAANLEILQEDPDADHDPEDSESGAKTGKKLGELGWILKKEYWHQGYAYEAAKAIMEFGKSSLGIRHFIAHCDAENTGSWHLMERLGMKRTGVSEDRKNRLSDEERTEYRYDMRMPENA